MRLPVTSLLFYELGGNVRVEESWNGIGLLFIPYVHHLEKPADGYAAIDGWKVGRPFVGTLRFKFQDAAGRTASCAIYAAENIWYPSRKATPTAARSRRVCWRTRPNLPNTNIRSTL